MTDMMRRLKNAAVGRVCRACKRFHEDERGVDIVVMVMVLIVMVALVVLFRDTVTQYMKDLFAKLVMF